MSTAVPLAGLPGSSADPGTGPCVTVLLDELLDDAGPLPAHRDVRASWFGDLAGPLLVPAEAADPLAEGLASTDTGLRVLLTGSGGLEQALAGLAAARGRFLTDSRVEVVGVRVPLPAPPAGPSGAVDLGVGLGVDLGSATRRLLDRLHFAVPAWLELGAVDGWEAVLDVLATDGAEHLSLRADGVPAALAAMLRRGIDLDLTLRLGGLPAPVISSGPGVTPGVLNALCAVRAALNGAEEPEINAVLAETRAEPLVSALRRMSAADAAVARAFLVGVQVADVAGTAAELARLGLVPDAGSTVPAHGTRPS